MKDFINLDEQEQNIPLLPNYPHSISNIKLDTKIIDGIIDNEEVEGICADYDVITITKIDSKDNEEEDIDHICIKEDCDVSKYYGCTNGDDGFQKDNLFSELTDEYQRTVARINLGIADEYALKWGNIKGNLSNQKDLYTFVTDSIAFDINKVIDEINLKLAQWACEIEIRFKNKADIFSPNFIGTPTTTLPLMTDSSNRIASTEWVNAKIAAAAIDENVKAISLDPEYMCYGDEPTDVKVVWEYYKDVDEQTLNGVILSPDIREYVFAGMTTSMVVTLRYKYEDIIAAKIITFDIKYPIYYGTSPDYTKNKQTIDNIFVIDTKLNEFMYVMIPNGVNSVLAVSSIIGGFKLLGTQEIFGNVYYIFKSANANLGETTVEILSQDSFDPAGFDTTSIRELLAAKADKYAVYDKVEIDQMFDDFSTGEGGLKNYYTKVEVDGMIPDVSGKADKNEIPIRTSDLINNSGFLTEIPKEFITEAELNSKGYLTEEFEPQFLASAAKNINSSDIHSWNNKVDKAPGMGLSESNFTQIEKAKLGGLTNYSDAAIKKTILDLTEVVETKAALTDIPDIAGKADKAEIPTRVSQLENDKNYLTTLPEGLITEDILNGKGFLTEFIETDPTVPLWAKQPFKPSYTLEELGAEAEGSAAQALTESLKYTNEQLGVLLAGAHPSYTTFKQIGDTILAHTLSIENIDKVLETKADKSELFSRKYTDLIGPPTIPSIVGLASEVWVTGQIAAIPETDLSELATKLELDTKVDKVENKGLSEQNFTSSYRIKLEGLTNYNDTDIKTSIDILTNFKNSIEGDTVFITKELYNAETLDIYFPKFDDAVTYIQSLLNAKLVVLEHATYKSLVCYRKNGTSIKDTEGVSYIELTLMFYYDDIQELQMIFKYNSTGVYEFTKTLIPSSSAGTEVIISRLTALEGIVNSMNIRDALILE